MHIQVSIVWSMYGDCKTRMAFVRLWVKEPGRLKNKQPTSAVSIALLVVALAHSCRVVHLTIAVKK